MALKNSACHVRMNLLSERLLERGVSACPWNGLGDIQRAAKDRVNGPKQPGCDLNQAHKLNP